MFVIEVVPLSRGTSAGALTYYSPIAYALGTILTVPLRGQEARALVTKVEHLSTAKTAVRAATFTLKRLPEQAAIGHLPEAVLKTALALADRFPATLGAILFAILPPEIREGTVSFDPSHDDSKADTVPEIAVLSAPFSERLDIYRRRIREAFAHRGSVLLVVPTAVYVERLAEALNEGIADRIVTFSPRFSSKRLARSYQELFDLSVSKLIVTTPAYAFVDRHDILDVIIEQSRNPQYRSRLRPYIDYKEALITMSRQSARKVLLADTLVDPEDEWQRREEVFETEGEHQHRLHFDSDFRVVKQKDKPTADEPFSLLSEELINEIDATLKRKGTAFVFAARRGLAPVVACGDCGHIFRCPDSGTPYSLLRTHQNGEEKRWFLSSTSGRRVKAADNCPACGSWRLRERGIGIQHIHDEMRKRWPEDKIVLFDHTTVKNPRRAAELIYDFYDGKGMILLGTAMAIPYLEHAVDLSAIVSADAARSIPTWRADEEFLALLLTLREITTGTVILQTRSEPDEIVSYAKTGQIELFFNDELALRKSLGYPPFSVFVHLTIEGPAETLKPLEAEITTLLNDWSVIFYSAPESLPAKTVRYGLIKVPRESWPDGALLACLRSLPPSVRIELNPARIV